MLAVGTRKPTAEVSALRPNAPSFPDAACEDTPTMGSLVLTGLSRFRHAAGEVV